MSEYTERFIKNVLAERKRQGLSAQKLADKTGGIINRSWLASLETGRSDNLRLDYAIALAEALDTSIIELLSPLRPQCLTRVWADDMAALETTKARMADAAAEYEQLKQRIGETY